MKPTLGNNSPRYHWPDSLIHVQELNVFDAIAFLANRQKTGGHNGVSSMVDLVVTKEENLIVHICSTIQVRYSLMNLKHA